MTDAMLVHQNIHENQKKTEKKRINFVLLVR